MITSTCIFPAVAEESDFDETRCYSVTEAYEYPVTTGSEEWSSLESLDEKIEVCRVDENVLNSMTTQALLETVLNYPLLINVFAFNTVDEGIHSVMQYFSGLQILFERDDAEACILDYLQIQTYADRNEDELSDNDLVKKAYLTSFYQYMTEAEISPLISTPGGTPVTSYYNMTWSDHGTTKAQAQAQENLIKATYPNATELAGINPAYNCHSYAFYSASTSNKYWINDPNPYLSDGSYTKMSSASAGYRACWAKSEHSAIVYSVSGSTIRVTSKWGAYGLFRHKLNDCPYSGSVSYWKG